MDSIDKLSKIWFFTGEKVIYTGKYKILDHVESTHDCESNSENQEVELKQGQLFPVHKPCNKGALWRLVALEK